MKVADFWEKLFEGVKLPFEYDDVEDIVFLGGTTFVQLKNGETWTLLLGLLDKKETVSSD